MGAKKVLTSFIHCIKIQGGITALPAPGGHEGVFLPVNEVGIFTAACTEPGMEIIGHRNDLMNHY